MLRVNGHIERRLLINFHADADVVQSILPGNMRPQLAHGHAIVGICLIRMSRIRPHSIPGGFGLRTENAAHRFAVEWDGPNGIESGVFVPRRDTNSRLATAVGGRLFPGVQHLAKFEVNETSDKWQITLESRDSETSVAVQVSAATQLDETSVFNSVTEASAFFESGACGYSTTSNHARLDGLKLCTSRWDVQPATIDSVKSSYFDNRKRFPIGSIEPDCALLMRNIPVHWERLKPFSANV